MNFGRIIWETREVAFGLHEHTGCGSPPALLVGNRVRTCWTAREIGELSSFAWAVVVPERVANGRSCKKSKLKYLSPFVFFVLAFSVQCALLGLLDLSSRIPYPEIQQKSGHSLHVQFSIANLLIITGFVNIAKGHWDTISKCLLLVWPQANKFSLHGISKRSGLTGLSSSDEEFSYVVKMVTQKITLFPSLLKWNRNVPAILSDTHTHTQKSLFKISVSDTCNSPKAEGMNTFQVQL